MTGAGDTAEPRVGIALAIFQPRLEDFAEQLRTIRSQRWGNWHCFITSDSPLLGLKGQAPLAPFFTDARFSWAENGERLGPGRNFCRAMTWAADSGCHYIACADQDDVWYPQKLERLVEEIRTKPPLSLVHADMDLLTVEGKLEPSAWKLERRRVGRMNPTAQLLHNLVTGASMMVDAELVRRYRDLPDSGLLHDEWFATIACCLGGVYPIEERLHAYRQHATNLIGAHVYDGLLDGLSLEQMLATRAEAVRAFERRRALVRGLEEAGVPLSRWPRFAFLNRFDAGLAILLSGACSLGDVTRARESLPLGIGKLLSLFGVEAQNGSDSTAHASGRS